MEGQGERRGIRRTRAALLPHGCVPKGSAASFQEEGAMRTRTKIQEIALILLTVGFTLCGCGQRNPLGVVADQRGDPPWVKRDEQGRIRAIGRPASGSRADSTRIDEATSRDDAPWVRRDEQGRIRAIGKPALGPREGEDAALIERPKGSYEERI